MIHLSQLHLPLSCDKFDGRRHTGQLQKERDVVHIELTKKRDR